MSEDLQDIEDELAVADQPDVYSGANFSIKQVDTIAAFYAFA